MNDERTRRIQERAHSIWEREGHPHGRDAQHWSQAEREIDGEDAARASSPTARTSARRRLKPGAVTKTVVDTSGASLEQATDTTAEVPTEEPVKTRDRKPKAGTEEGSEAPKARRGRSSEVAAEASEDAPVKTRGRKPKAVPEDGAEATKAPRGRKAKAVPAEGSGSSPAAGEAEPKATAIAEGGEQTPIGKPQDAGPTEEPTVAPEVSRTDK